MRRFFTIPRCLIVLLVLGGLCSIRFEESAQARPRYFSQFKKKYKKISTLAKKTRCFVCHASKKNKKERNDYGRALKGALGKKDEKDIAKIVEAMDKAAREKSSVDGKTFGDLIKDGKLPGKQPKKK